MSPLATTIYEVLRQRVPSTSDPRIGYAALAASLPEGPSIDWQSREVVNGLRAIANALDEIIDACRAAGLPCIVALVVQCDHGQLGYPGEGYFRSVHPKVKSQPRQLALWGQELERVKQTTYPARLTAASETR